MAPAYQTRFAKPALDGLAIFSLTLAEQPHLHKEFDHMPIVGDACDTNAGTQPASILPLSYARGCALEHAKIR
jgi:hypothetical protein